MEILRRENGILLLKQYGKTYIRFSAGGVMDQLYQISVSENEIDLILNKGVDIGLIVNRYMNEHPELPNGLQDRMILDYLEYTTDYSKKRKNAIIEKLHKYGDIFYEFYYYVLSETYEDGVEEAGYTASSLVKGYPLSPLGAYNYLIYLREDATTALADLKKGLPRK